MAMLRMSRPSWWAQPANRGRGSSRTQPANFAETCGAEGTSKRCRHAKMTPPRIGEVTSAHVKKLFVPSVMIVAVALSAPVHAADLPYAVAKVPIVLGFD